MLPTLQFNNPQKTINIGLPTWRQFLSHFTSDARSGAHASVFQSGFKKKNWLEKRELGTRVLTISKTFPNKFDKLITSWFSCYIMTRLWLWSIHMHVCWLYFIKFTRSVPAVSHWQLQTENNYRTYDRMCQKTAWVNY